MCNSRGDYNSLTQDVFRSIGLDVRTLKFNIDSLIKCIECPIKLSNNMAVYGFVQSFLLSYHIHGIIGESNNWQITLKMKQQAF